MLRNILAAAGIAALAAAAPAAHAHRGGGFDPGISIAIGDTYGSKCRSSSRLTGPAYTACYTVRPTNCTG